jgi:hypothetical protein
MMEYDVSMGAGPEEDLGEASPAGDYDNIEAMGDMVPEDPEASVSEYGTPQTDVGGCVTMNIPLFIRVLEMMREELPEGNNGDELLHRIVEVAIDLCSQHGMLTMDHYDDLEAVKIANTNDGMVGGEMDGAMGEVEGEVEGDEECDAIESDDEVDVEVDADEAAEDAEGDIEETPEPPVPPKADDEGESEEEGDDDDDDEDEGEEADKPPFESIQALRDPIMEEVAEGAYLGRRCVTVRNEDWEYAKTILSNAWDHGYKTLVVDNAVILSEELALPNYQDDTGLFIARPYSKAEMLDEAFGRWFSLSDPRKVTYEELEEALNETELTAKSRDALPSGDFVFPEERKYPIHDESHARNALSRVAQHGTAEEKAKVKAAVDAKFPEIGKDE